MSARIEIANRGYVAIELPRRRSEICGRFKVIFEIHCTLAPHDHIDTVGEGIR